MAILLTAFDVAGAYRPPLIRAVPLYSPKSLVLQLMLHENPLQPW